MQVKNILYLPSGRIFLTETSDGFLIESTEMRDVSINGKENIEVRDTLDPHIIWKHLKPYEEKWLLTVSTQKGCCHKCNFCDVGSLGFHGNLCQKQIELQIKDLLCNTPYVTKSNKVKIGFARMGEPAHNLENVISVIKKLPTISNQLNREFNWLPCFNTILPDKTLEGLSGFDVIDRIIDLKEKFYNGFLHFQISCNSTDEDTRKKLFAGAQVLSIEDVVKYINTKTITNRTITLNFIVMKNIPIDINKLVDLGLNKEKFTVKLIPLNNTIRAQVNKLEPFANYNNYRDLITLEEEFKKYDIPVVMDAIAKCEEAGLCCGQLAQLFK